MDFETPCALCGQAWPAPDPSLQVAPPLADEVSRIEGDIDRLESLISQLNERRVTLRRRLNDLKSATKALPPEVLSTIFQHVLPLDDLAPSPQPRRIQEFIGFFAPITLAAVSSDWREAAQSTPQLWTRIAVEVHSSTSQRTVALLRLYLRNSKEFPMSLALFARCTDESDGERNELMTQLGAYLDPVSRLIFIENPDRIKSLYLDRAPLEWLPFLTDDFEQLEDLQLEWPQIPNDWRSSSGITQLMGVPSLRRVTMRNLHWSVQVSWSTLTFLDLYNVSIDASVNLLLSCRNIIEYHQRDTAPGAALGGVLRQLDGATAVFPNLKVFGWSFTSNGEHDVALFRAMQVPVLEKLCFYTDHPFWRNELTAGFIYFLSRLPSTLSVLELVNLTGSEAFLDEIFGSGINPQTLGIIVDSPQFLSTILDVLRPSRSSRPDKYLPNLENIYIRGVNGHPGIFDRMYPDDYPHYEGNLVELFVRMVEERWDRDDVVFTFEQSNVWRSTSWTPFAKERLKGILDSGIQLQIIENSRPL